MLIHKGFGSSITKGRTIITMGMFDGVHKGHQEIINQLVEEAHKHKAESVIVSFSPHPRQVLSPDHDFKLLSIFKEKIELLEAYGIDHFLILPFSKEFASQDAARYLNDIVNRLQPAKIILGYDHRFGKDRVGDINFIRQKAALYDYDVVEVKKQLVDDITISSTQIRKALVAGDIQTANQLIGRNYTLSGKVIHGDHQGKGLGYPTANIQTEKDKLIPAEGIYAVRVIIGKQFLGGMLYIGQKPSYGGKPLSIEVNIFEFNQEIYGEDIQLEFIAFLRKDEKYSELALLQAQLAKDKEDALRVIYQTKPSRFH